ncbi:MAG: tRNA lysidine(34) synthetase TilS [Prevotellaceae bacterium]|jgi:tRNA(Ile)-lysidine synthase|nr:tRNA lysidine(34) synthetase TilS [Prevotellaceae bacterium]
MSIRLCNIEKSKKYLLAVSGGMDSMVMAHLFAKSDCRCAIAHCNFSLRESESDGDEKFVASFARQHDMPLFAVRFDTREYAANHGLSTQLAARNLRYEWFEKIRRENGFHKTAVAHNSDDNLETFFINLARGAGLSGLHGIPGLTEALVRPLLRFSRSDIEQYASDNTVPFREDSSNASDKYLRNRIRHLLLPALDRIDSGFRKKANESISYLNEADLFVKSATGDFLLDHASLDGADLHIPLEALRASHSRTTTLFYILSAYGFKRKTIADACRCMDRGESGRSFHSSSHVLLIDRAELIVAPVKEPYPALKVHHNSDFYFDRFEMHCEAFDRPDDFVPAQTELTGEFDMSKLSFPLTLRHIEDGDRFVPLGMKGSKKLSDFLIDRKVPLIEKKRCMVLLSDGEIVWVAGLRIDDRFKATETSKRIFRIKIIYFTPQ